MNSDNHSLWCVYVKVLLLTLPQTFQHAENRDLLNNLGWRLG